ncbi:MAG: fumarylacetoacetase [Saprospiraceae bacterium]
MTSWLNIDQDSDFSIYNIPFGIGRINGQFQIVSRIGDHVIDLDALQDIGIFVDDELPYGIFLGETLNEFIELGKPVTNSIRFKIQKFCADKTFASGFNYDFEDVFFDAKSVEMSLPVNIGDYSDFYSSKEHATNVGIMFRGVDNALMPNWLHLPVAYHGRSSSIVVSGTPIKRPKGQIPNKETGIPSFGPTKEMDIEVEMAFVIGKKTLLGDSIAAAKAEDYIFGMVLFNDWSARDIQRWEYVPLGPFLGKNFGSTISPWIVTMEALEPFRTSGPDKITEVLEYLVTEGDKSFDINISASLQSSLGVETEICKTNYKDLYWNPSQQLAHHTVNGCNMNIGDLLASGTISGESPDSFGSLLELSWNGTKPLRLNDGTTRTYLLDGDIVTLRGYSINGEIRVGFGEAIGQIVS